MKRELGKVPERPFIKLDGVVNRFIEVAKNRMLLVCAVFSFAFVLAGLRLLDVSVIGGLGEPSVISESARATLKTGRADIVDRNGILLATSLSVPSLYADPSEVLDAEAAVDALKTVLFNLDKKNILAKLKQKKRFVWLKRGLTPEQQLKINALGVPGFHFQEEDRRFYPQGRLGSHIIGFSGTDAVGLSGVEKQFDGILRDGSEPLSLSIDVRIQHILREEIQRQIESFEAIGGAGVLLDANSGEILGMISLPDFDPAFIKGASSQAKFNRATLGVYEMGSTFKIFNTALALDLGSATMTSGYDATKPIRIARHTINDYRPKKRWLSVPEIFMYSSNIGSAKMADEFGALAQKEFMKELGFFNQLDVELPERASPILPARWRRINTMTISYGHGIAVSPLHLTSGVATIVNGGIRWPVTILKRHAGQQAVGKQVISSKTSLDMRRILRLVVENGTGKKASANGYLVGGKTGTAEKQAVQGGYAKKLRLSSFVGAFPIHDPKYVVLVMVDEPKGNKDSFGYATGGWVAAPAVKRIVSRSAPLLGVHPKNELSPKIRQILEININPGGGKKRLASF